MNKKGYTLVELMATIIILGVITLTLTYVVKGQIDKSKKNAFKEDMRSIMRAAELYKEENDLSSFTIDVSDLELKKIGNITGKVILQDGVITLYNITDNNYCGNGTSENYTILEEQCNNSLAE